MDGQCGTAECKSSEDCPAGLSCVNYRCQVDDGARSGLDTGDCELESIYFEFDSTELTSDMRRVLERNRDCMSKATGRVTLEGHCDPRGTTEYNMALGERRARMVRKALNTLGVENSRMRAISKGEEEAAGRGEDGWARDRRVEFE
jgi:peptidoglycan-associated lipoprotein